MADEQKTADAAETVVYIVCDSALDTVLSTKIFTDYSCAKDFADAAGDSLILSVPLVETAAEMGGEPGGIQEGSRVPVEYFRLWPDGSWDTDWIEIPRNTPIERYDAAVREAASRIAWAAEVPAIVGFYYLPNDEASDGAAE